MITEAPPYTTKVTQEEYLVRERAAEYKSDYVYGEIRAMAGASLAHNTINANLTVEIGSQLKGKPCRPLTSDMRLLADPGGLYVYPDLTVVCEEPILADDKLDILVNPTLIFEILSRSTESYDRGLKAIRYREIESLREYVFISQEEPLIERYSRQPDGLWLIETVRGLTASVHIASIDCTLALAEIYDRVEFGVS